MKKKISLFLLIIPFLVGCGGRTYDDSEPPLPSIGTDLDENEVLLDFFGLNDFHGAITESSTEPGWFRIASYLKAYQRHNEGGVINLSSGDMWQGSADSNITRGKLLTDLMNDLNFEAMAIGNHEFDWRDTYIYENQELSNFPLLGSNIIDKRTGKVAGFVEESPIIERNGVKIGIIGTIGPSLETSIFYEAVKDYEFDVPDNYIVEESKALRARGADLIALLTHDSLVDSSYSYNETFYGNENNGKPYVDFVFSGHSHTLDRHTVNGVPILQTNGNGKQIMHISLVFNKVTKEKEIYNYETIDQENIRQYKEDEVAKAIYNDYYEREIKAVKEEVVGTLTYGLTNRSSILNLANEAMFETFVVDYPDLGLAVHNYGGVRVNSIPAGEVTYGDLYKAFPFDNEIRIIENVSQGDALNVKSNNAYYLPPGSEIVGPTTIVTIDYVSTRYTLASYPQILTGQYIRDVIADYFRGRGTINGALY